MSGRLYPTPATLQIIAEYEACRRYMAERGGDPGSMLNHFVQARENYPTDHLEMIAEHEAAASEYLEELRKR